MERTLHSALPGALQPNGHWIHATDVGAGLRFASHASPGIAGKAAYRVRFPQPTVDR